MLQNFEERKIDKLDKEQLGNSHQNSMVKPCLALLKLLVFGELTRVVHANHKEKCGDHGDHGTGDGDHDNHAMSNHCANLALDCQKDGG